MFIERISHSKAESFRECHYKYYAKYHEHLPEKSSNTALQFGSYIHKICERGVNEFTLSGLEKIAEEELDNYKFDTKEYPLSKINKCIKNFLKFNTSLQASETIGLELNETIEFDNIKYNGIIDRVLKGKDGSLLIIDYKTSKREKTKLDLYQDQQLVGYATMLSEKLKIPLNKITCAHFYPLTGNFVTIQYTNTQKSSFKKNIKSVVWAIRKKTKLEFSPMKNQYCNWCAFKYACKLYTPEEEVNRILLEHRSKNKDEDKSQTKE